MTGPRFNGTVAPPVGSPASGQGQQLKRTSESAEKEFVKHLPPEDQQAIQDSDAQAASSQTDGNESTDVRDRSWFRHLPVDDQQAILASQAAGHEEIAEPETESRADQIREELEHHPAGQAALDRLVDSPSFQALNETQQDDILEEFRRAPNDANAQYLEGLSRVRVERTEADFESGTADLAYYNEMLKPDAGELQIGGETLNIRNGNLFNESGEKVGRVRTDGSYRLNGEEAQNYYEDVNARVHLIEDGKVILNLYPADPAGHLEDASINAEFRSLATGALESVRRDGNNVRVTDGFRSVEDQNLLYAQGRTTPGDIVTGARGGSSYHNYGLAADVVNLDSVGDVEGSTEGEYADRWERYGEHVQAQGMEWGGSWSSIVDLPHMELHPGLTASDAGTLLDEYQSGGLPAVWNELGLGAN